jgi:hypothetical protein
LDGLDRTQEEFHQVFNSRMEDVEEDLQVLKTDVDVMRIEMSSFGKDMKDVEASIDNAHF